VSADALDAALWRVGEQGLVAYPTETVWGLGADARSDAALSRLRAWKGRSDDAPVAILVDEPARLEGLGFALGTGARRLAGAFWPGPLTLVLPCRGRFARGVARVDGAVGVRCSPHPVAAALARRCARAGVGPLTATSLNRSGAPAARTRDDARALCGGDGPEAPLLLAIGEAGGGAPSTVLDLTGERPAVLRWGAVPEPALAPVLKESFGA
jgi:L-threonylcarbamoyladenylate synthase